MKRNLIAVSLLIVGLVLYAPSWVRAEEESPPKEEEKATTELYSGVSCEYFREFEVWKKIDCGLLPLKQTMGLLMGYYVDPPSFNELTKIVISAGIKSVDEFKYREGGIKNLGLPYIAIEGAVKDYNLDPWQWRRVTYALRPLAQKLAAVERDVEKKGPRAFELLLKETRDAVIAALMQNLDPHTDFYSLGSEEWRQVFDSLQGMHGAKFGGIGAALGKFGSVQVVMPFPGTPAGDALKRYDEIVKVDGVSVVTPGEAAAKIRGPLDTNVTLLIRRNGEEKKVILVRKEIQIPSVTGELYTLGGHRICYIFLHLFAPTTGKEVRKLFDEKEVCGSADGYVLDLRNNAGGTMGSALEVAQALLPPREADAASELLLRVSGSRLRKPELFYRDATQALRQWKTRPVIFINAGSVSASEIVVGILRPYVTLVGDRTFGKCAVMMQFLLADGSFFTNTMGNFSFRDGSGNCGKGFLPDVYYVRQMFTKEIPEEKVVRREETLPRYHGNKPQFTEEETLLTFLSEYDPELAIGLSLIAHPEKFPYGNNTEKKGGTK